MQPVLNFQPVQLIPVQSYFVNPTPTYIGTYIPTTSVQVPIQVVNPSSTTQVFRPVIIRSSSAHQLTNRSPTRGSPSINYSFLPPTQTTYTSSAQVVARGSPVQYSRTIESRIQRADPVSQQSGLVTSSLQSQARQPVVVDSRATVFTKSPNATTVTPSQVVREQLPVRRVYSTSSLAQPTHQGTTRIYPELSANPVIKMPTAATVTEGNRVIVNPALNFDFKLPSAKGLDELTCNQITDRSRLASISALSVDEFHTIQPANTLSFETPIKIQTEPNQPKQLAKTTPKYSPLFARPSASPKPLLRRTESPKQDRPAPRELIKPKDLINSYSTQDNFPSAFKTRSFAALQGQTLKPGFHQALLRKRSTSSSRSYSGASEPDTNSRDITRSQQFGSVTESYKLS